MFHHVSLIDAATEWATVAINSTFSSPSDIILLSVCLWRVSSWKIGLPVLSQVLALLNVTSCWSIVFLPTSYVFINHKNVIILLNGNSSSKKKSGFLIKGFLRWVEVVFLPLRNRCIVQNCTLVLLASHKSWSCGGWRFLSVWNNFVFSRTMCSWVHRS